MGYGALEIAGAEGYPGETGQRSTVYHNPAIKSGIVRGAQPALVLQTATYEVHTSNTSYC